MPVYHSAVCGLLIDGSTDTQQPVGRTTLLPCARVFLVGIRLAMVPQVAQHIDLGISQTADVH
jgi:hypothetical protein